MPISVVAVVVVLVVVILSYVLMLEMLCSELNLSACCTNLAGLCCYSAPVLLIVTFVSVCTFACLRFHFINDNTAFFEVITVPIWCH